MAEVALGDGLDGVPRQGEVPDGGELPDGCEGAEAAVGQVQHLKNRLLVRFEIWSLFKLLYLTLSAILPGGVYM